MAGFLTVIDWLFRNRQTGELTVAQRPNLSLSVFALAMLLRLVASPTGNFRTAVDVVAAVSLGAWSLDEILRGVNPFRRLLGAVVGALLVVSIAR